MTDFESPGNEPIEKGKKLTTKEKQAEIAKDKKIIIKLFVSDINNEQLVPKEKQEELIQKYMQEYEILRSMADEENAPKDLANKLKMYRSIFKLFNLAKQAGELDLTNQNAYQEKVNEIFKINRVTNKIKKIAEELGVWDERYKFNKKIKKEQ